MTFEAEIEERGRLKRRRHSSHSPRRASSPSRGHERNSGSRYREHHRKHHRPSSPASSISPPTLGQKKMRRRSDAEPDHTFRGRVRLRSGSRGATRSPLLESDVDGDGNADVDVKIVVDHENPRRFRRRSQPPSRHKIKDEEGDVDGDTLVELRRQRSYHQLRKAARRDSKGEDGEQR
ncbi:hypothetical protein GQ44DRAFT_455074 [Phaeosphaeriaceae sp. PMI808]|nr:hypothetical protein GQ44DRAFT_455074 [Phaeosphaeriaceae sp. PMI808]